MTPLSGVGPFQRLDSDTRGGLRDATPRAAGGVPRPGRVAESRAFRSLSNSRLRNLEIKSGYVLVCGLGSRRGRLPNPESAWGSSPKGPKTKTRCISIVSGRLCSGGLPPFILIGPRVGPLRTTCPCRRYVVACATPTCCRQATSCGDRGNRPLPTGNTFGSTSTLSEPTEGSCTKCSCVATVPAGAAASHSGSRLPRAHACAGPSPGTWPPWPVQHHAL